MSDDSVNLREALEQIAKLDHGRPLLDARTIARAALASPPAPQVAPDPPAHLTRIQIPTETMEQEFQSYYRRGYDLGYARGKEHGAASSGAPQAAIGAPAQPSSVHQTERAGKSPEAADEDRANAARYLWLRDAGSRTWNRFQDQWRMSAAECDRAIDRERNRSLAASGPVSKALDSDENKTGSSGAQAPGAADGELEKAARLMNETGQGEHLGVSVAGAVRRPAGGEPFEPARDCIHHGTWVRVDETEPATVLNWGCDIEARGQARCRGWCGDLKRCPAALAE